MKYLFIIFFLFSTLMYGQTLKGVISFTPKKATGENGDSELFEKGKKSILYGYVFSNNISLQELISNEGTTIDTTYITDSRLNDHKLETTQTYIKAHSVNHYKDYQSNIYRFESATKNKNLITEYVSIKDSISNYSWELSSDTLTVAGYTCKKATTIRDVGTKQNITAWYCEDFPINDGPMDFSGLPGLILQIELGDYNIVKFEKLKFFKDENIKIEEPENKVEMITMKQYIAKLMNGG